MKKTTPQIFTPISNLNQYKIELPDTSLTDTSLTDTSLTDTSLTDTSMISPIDFLSSPSPNEKLIIPVTINDRPSRNYTLTHRRHHMRPKTHKTYRVYKIHKNNKHSRSKSKHSRSKSKNK
jgi:hypothetical protein